jgi:hypothetical protein
MGDLNEECSKFQIQTAVDIGKFGVKLDAMADEFQRVSESTLARLEALERENKTVSRMVIGILSTGLMGAASIIYHNLSGK